jgi:ATP-dependent Lon protease
MEILRIPGYTEEEKLEIAKAHLVPRQIAEHGLSAEQIAMSDDAVRAVINEYTREAGVRNLDREIANVCRKVARRVVEGQQGKAEVTPENVGEFLGPIRFFRELSERAGLPGVATGLAWTQVGGEILFVESSRMRGKGKVIITGRLGEVMKESALAALTWIRANARTLKLDETIFDRSDFHIHIPAGAIPKDGPSAGITLACSLVSLLTGIPVADDLAMTGEITLRGKVLPVGGIKEKIIAAKSAGITRVILPHKNEKDLEDVTASVRDALAFSFVQEIDEVLTLAFGEALRQRPDVPPVEERWPRRDDEEEAASPYAVVVENSPAQPDERC